MITEGGTRISGLSYSPGGGVSLITEGDERTSGRPYSLEGKASSKTEARCVSQGAFQSGRPSSRESFRLIK